MPTSFLELLLFAATLSPGFAFLKAAERRRPARSQTALRETAEMFLVGSSASLAALVLVAGGIELLGLGSIRKVVFGPVSYAEDHLVGLAAAGVGTYALACYLAFQAAQVIYGDKEALSEASAWYQAFRERLPQGGKNSVVVKLKSSKTFTGIVLDYTADNSPVGERELVLSVPDADLAPFAGQHDDRGVVQVVLNGDEIESIELLYVPVEPAPAST